MTTKTTDSSAPLSDAEVTKRALAHEFPAWSIIRARDTNRWWAIRRPNRVVVWPKTAIFEIEADTPDELRAKLLQAGR